MINVYSCGCHAVGESVISKCKTHGAHTIALIGDHVKQNEVYRSPDKSLTLIHDTFFNGMRRIKDARIDLILSYPDHVYFGARENLEDTAFTVLPDLYFRECTRVLKDNGHIILAVETFLLRSLLYAASMSNLHIRTLFPISMLVRDEPQSAKFIREYYRSKFCVVLAKTQGSVNNKFSSVGSALKHFYKDGTILDTSCIHWPFIFKAKTLSKSIGIVPNKIRYDNLIRRDRGELDG